MKAHIDFETRSKIDIKKAGAYKYAQHDSTEIMCMQYAIGENDPVLWTPNDKPPQELFDFIDSGQPVVAHNAFFERQIWKFICVERYGWQQIPIKQWQCSAAKAASYALPRALDKAGKALKLSESDIKDEEGKRVMLKLSKPRKPTKHDKSEWHENPEDFNILYEYCEQDVIAERAIDHVLKDLRAEEQELWHYDQIINDRGVQIDVEAVSNAVEMIDEIYNNLVYDLQLVTGGKVQTLKQQAKLVNYLREDVGFSIPNLQKATLDTILNDTSANVPVEAQFILNLRRQGGMSSVSKYQAMLNAACEDGRIRDIVMYHGASTGRWTGKLVQTQNLPRGILKTFEQQEAAIQCILNRDIEGLSAFGNLIDVMSSCIRGMFIAPEGKDLIAADFNAIETRVLWWLAENEYGLNLFHNSQCPYIDMANTIYKTDKVTKADPRRQLGKTAILGLGYGMGATKFEATCENMGIPVDAKLAKSAVDTYRTKYSMVRNLWYEYERAAKSAIENSGKVFVAGKVKWGVSGKFLYAKLPSGRCLAYAYPRIETYFNEDWGKDVEQICFKSVVNGKWVDDSTYGGMLTENITQAVSRDLLADAIKRCEQRGYPVVMHVHDEIVSEIDESFGSEEEFIDILCEKADWATEIPIKAESWRGKRYRK